MVDYSTAFFEVWELPSTLSAVVIQALKQQFAQYEVPLIVQSDGGHSLQVRSLGVFTYRLLIVPQSIKWEGSIGGKNCQETLQTKPRPVHGSFGVSQHPKSRVGTQPSSTSAGEAYLECVPC